MATHTEFCIRKDASGKPYAVTRVVEETPISMRLFQVEHINYVPNAFPGYADMIGPMGLASNGSNWSAAGVCTAIEFSCMCNLVQNDDSYLIKPTFLINRASSVAVDPATGSPFEERLAAIRVEFKDPSRTLMYASQAGWPCFAVVENGSKTIRGLHGFPNIYSNGTVCMDPVTKDLFASGKVNYGSGKRSMVISKTDPIAKLLAFTMNQFFTSRANGDLTDGKDYLTTTVSSAGTITPRVIKTIPTIGTADSITELTRTAILKTFESHTAEKK